MTAIRVVERPELPDIKIGPDVARMADEAIKSLKGVDGIYERGGRLVTVVRTSEPPRYRKGERVERALGTPTIRTLSFPTLFERLSSTAIWLRRRKGDWAATMPHERAARAVFERGEWGGIRSLVGVTSAPTFRADGSIMQVPGFDEATGLLYWPNAPYPRVPETPRRDDAANAYESLCATVRAFPFADPTHRAAWVCSLLSILARPAIDGPVPLFVMDANTRGAGKSKLVDAAFRIALGYDAPRTALPQENEEIRKTITSCVLAGDQAVLFDNVSRKLGGEAIEAAITGTAWKARRLGSDDQMSAPMRIVFFATGNNLTLSSDLARRSMHVRLESPLENPEDRSDVFDIAEWIDEKRHHLVTWGLTLLRAWHVAGRPTPSKSMGSFEGWSAVIPQAVHWACGVDPIAARASADPEEDGERMAIAAVLACVEHLAASSPITTKQIITALYGGGESRDGSTTPDHSPTFPGAREALEAMTFCKGGHTPDTGRVGKFLEKIEKRVVGGKRLVRGPMTHNRATWTVNAVR